ncbi:hypothetical protein, partial [Gordonibacter sp.]|uniref:hypothetical protein n=1 Tax=Gordonibacter sp. TaxID=1968902 RepID=UPI002FC94140
IVERLTFGGALRRGAVDCGFMHHRTDVGNARRAMRPVWKTGGAEDAALKKTDGGGGVQLSHLISMRSPAC